MKTYTRIRNNCVLVEEEGKDPYVLTLERIQGMLASLREQKAKYNAREAQIEAEIAEIILALGRNNPN